MNAATAADVTYTMPHSGGSDTTKCLRLRGRFRNKSDSCSEVRSSCSLGHSESRMSALPFEGRRSFTFQ
jgi:hypothetical protein